MIEMPDFTRIVQDPMDARNDYFRQEFPKRQIFIHHSYSHPDPASLISRWRRARAKVGSALVIAGTPIQPEGTPEDGTIFSAFPSRFWAVHLGVHHPDNDLPARFKKREHSRFLERHSISIHLCSAGPLTWENGRFFTAFRTVVPESQVIEYVDEFRKERFYQKYSAAQLENLKRMLNYLCAKFNIPQAYLPDMWDISERALMGTPGIYTHASVRTDKHDCHPQPELVAMLQQLDHVPELPMEVINAEAEEETDEAPMAALTEETADSEDPAYESEEEETEKTE